MAVSTLNARAIQPDWFSAQRVAARLEEPTSKSKHLMLACTLFLVLLLQLWLRVSIIDLGYRLEALRRETLQNDELLRAKRLEWATQSRPAALSEESSRRLGLVHTTPQRLRRLEIG